MTEIERIIEEWFDNVDKTTEHLAKSIEQYIQSLRLSEEEVLKVITEWHDNPGEIVQGDLSWWLHERKTLSKAICELQRGKE